MADEAEQEHINSGPRRSTPTDEHWGEVYCINSYAMTMAYLSMGVRGLAFLVITWTTVVLLGGFVYVLGKKDFWGLTVIILAQAAGVFDVFPKEKLSKIWYVYKDSLRINLLSGLTREIWDGSDWVGILVHLFVCLLETGVQAMVLSMVMCPLAAVLFGLYISTVISLWRLIEHDYGDANGGANLKPALQVLYSLALVQGVLFCYRAYFARTEKHIVKTVSEDYEFGDEENLVLDYTRETQIGCEKDPTFAKGRNLITYAVDLIKSESPDQVISGVTILQKIISLHRGEADEDWLPFDKDERTGQHMLIKQLIGSTSSSRILQKLVQMLDPRSPCDMQMRRRAADIVAHLAGDIHLEQFPRGIQCITSLLNEEYRLMEPYQRDWILETFEPVSGSRLIEEYRRVYRSEPYRMSLIFYIALVLQGLRILRKLAADEENCRVMSNTEGLVSKITAPMCSNGLHSDHHYGWSTIAYKSLLLLGYLLNASGETGKNLQREISTHSQAISTMESILKCDKCHEKSSLQRKAILVLRLLCFRTSSSMSRERKQNFIRTLIDIFADDNKNNSTRKYAGEMLAKLSSVSSNDRIILILEAGDASVANLTGMLLKTEDKTLRTSAADILKNLCSHYNKDDECFEKLKRDITDVMPKVLGEVLRYGSTGDGIQTAAEAAKVGFSPPDTDLEKGDVSQENAQNTISPSEQQNDKVQEDRKLQEAVLSLCAMAGNKFISADPDLVHQFDNFAATICLEQEKPVKTFTYLVEEAQQLLDEKKAQELAIVPAVAESSSGET